MKKPLIGITAAANNISLNMSLSQSVTVVANSYIQIVNDYDCAPIIIPSLINLGQIKSVVSIIDGLILTSGQDLSPATYQGKGEVIYSKDISGIGEKFKRPLNLSPDVRRDQTEIALYQLAKEKNIPILGICRGMQLINIAEGGSLYEELPESTISHYLEPDGWINYHDIELNKNSLCATLLGQTTCVVSSIHHQAINRIGKELFVSGLASDGIIELIEHQDKTKFIIGIQSHVEKTRKNQPLFENIYKAFFEKAKISSLKPFRALEVDI